MTTVERCEPLAVNWHKMLTVSRKSCHHIKTPKYSKDFFLCFWSLLPFFLFFLQKENQQKNSKYKNYFVTVNKSMIKSVCQSTVIRIVPTRR